MNIKKNSISDKLEKVDISLPDQKKVKDLMKNIRKQQRYDSFLLPSAILLICLFCLSILTLLPVIFLIFGMALFGMLTFKIFVYGVVGLTISLFIVWLVLEHKLVERLLTSKYRHKPKWVTLASDSVFLAYEASNYRFDIQGRYCSSLNVNVSQLYQGDRRLPFQALRVQSKVIGVWLKDGCKEKMLLGPV